jgi:hypothetical protein
MADDKLKKILGALAPRKRMARQYLFEVLTDKNDLARTELIQFPTWFLGRHIPNSR